MSMSLTSVSSGTVSAGAVSSGTVSAGAVSLMTGHVLPASLFIERLYGVRTCIFSCLDAGDLISFEKSARGHKHLTDWGWGCIRVRDQWIGSINWQECEREHPLEREKWNYALATTLVRFVADQIKLNENFHFAIKTLARLRPLILRFPEFGSGLEKELSTILDPFSHPIEPLRRLASFRVVPAKVATGAPIGEVVARAIFTFNRFKEFPSNIYQEVFHIIPRAPYVVSLIEQMSEEWTADLLRMATEVARYGYFEPLERFAEQAPEHQLRSLKWDMETRGIVLPPVLYALHLHADDPAEQIEFLQKAVVGYGEHAPVYVLIAAAYLHYNLDEVEKCQQFINKAILKMGSHSLMEDLCMAATMKLNLSDYESAEKLYNWAIAKGIKEMPADALANAALVKFKSNKPSEVNTLCDQALIKFWENTLEDRRQMFGTVLDNIAYIEFQLKDYPKADLHYDQLQELAEQFRCEDEVSIISLINAALIKIELGNPRGGSLIYNKILFLLQRSVPEELVGPVSDLYNRLLESSEESSH